MDKIRKVGQGKQVSDWENNKMFMNNIAEIKDYNGLRWIVCFSIICAYFTSQYGWLSSSNSNAYVFFWFLATLGIMIECVLRLGLLKVFQVFANFNQMSFAKKSIYLFIEHLKNTWLFWFVIAFIRTFVIDYYHIPSQSMLPNFVVGDKVITYKPLSKLFVNDKYDIGDIVLFNFIPNQPNLNSEVYIKRVIAKAGDKIKIENGKINVVRNNETIINNDYVNSNYIGKYDYLKTNQNIVFLPKSIGDGISANMVNEKVNLNGKEMNYKIIYDVNGLNAINEASQTDKKNGVAFPTFLFNENLAKQHCNNFEIGSNKLDCVVPENHYFMMGDNRTASFDSRYWGFVKEKDIIDKVRFQF